MMYEPPKWNIPPPPPPIKNDKDFLVRVDDEIIRAARCIKDIHAKRRDTNAGTMSEWKKILRYLINHRKAVMTDRVPPLRDRQMRSICRMFVDWWHPEDVDGPWADEALGYYVMNERITFDPDHYAKYGRTHEVEAVIAEAPDLYELPTPPIEGWPPPDLPLTPPMRDMPHNPHRRSLMMPRTSALEFVANAVERRALAVERKDREFLKTYASQHLILAFTDHWLGESPASIRAHLEAAADAQHDALRLEWQPNAWEIFDTLHLGVVCGKTALIDALVGAAQNAFTDDRIRPIDFLSWLNLAVLDFARRDDDGLTTHLYHLHDALFNREQPIELDDELPLWKASFEVLHALRHKQGDSFNRTLAVREAERIRHFKRGGTSAPIALVDLHGLAWCALAKQRGLTVTIEHIYLPLAVLDR